MRKTIYETMVWGVSIFVLLLILNLVGVFKADFKDYKTDVTTKLVSNNLVDGRKYRALVFKVENATYKDWRWVEYSLILRVADTVVYSTHSIEPKWQLNAKDNANLTVKVPAFEGDVGVELTIDELEERSMFR